VSALAQDVEGTGLKWAISDSIVLTKRSLLRYVRIPSLVVFSTIQPVMFVLLFRYVFGGAITIPGGNYVDFLLPGVFVQSAAFGSIGTAIGLAEDVQGGMVERFKSLPIARSAVLVGRIASDTIRNLFVVSLMVAVGVLVGFRFHNGFLPGVEAVLLAVLFGMSFSMVSALIGLSVKDVESANAAGFIWMFPLVFASAIFVRVETMPGWLQVFARNSPLTAVVNAMRDLTQGGPVATDLLKAFAWIAGIVIVFAPLAVRQYRKIA
jgi:ABC-2 type transport system permease protein